MPNHDLNSKVEGSGPRVLLLHPVGLDVTCWDAVAAQLAPHHTVMRLDLRGHGRSPAAPARHALADYADDVQRHLAAQDFTPTAVVGLSFGGMIAQMLAVRHPATVTALAICGCGATFPPEAREMLRGRAERAEHGGMAAILDETLTRWFTPDFIAAGGAEPTRRHLLADDVAGWATAWRAISALDIQSELGTIRVPTLCLAGDRDPAAPPATLAAVAEHIPGACLQVLAGAPHMMQIETAEPFAHAIAAFLAAHGASPPA